MRKVQSYSKNEFLVNCFKNMNDFTTFIKLFLKQDQKTSFENGPSYSSSKKQQQQKF